MSMKDIFGQALGWMKGTGPESDIALGSRVRLARNLRGTPFPAVASKAQLSEVLERTIDATRDHAILHDARIIHLRDLAPLQRQILVERHLISPQHAEKVEHKGVILRPDEAVSVMVNEEDHLRIQGLFPGMQPMNAWKLVAEVDEGYEARLGYAFSQERGHLTSCPTNVGTGMRASIMVHLPALTMTEQMARTVAAVHQVGLAVRGIYGEGTDVLGNIYQLSNQVTLGHAEEDIIQHLVNVTRRIVEQEREARQRICKNRRIQLEDRVWRSYGLLTHARSMTSQEAMQYLSDVRLGIDLGILEGIEGRILQELLVLIRPAHLQKIMGKELEAPERDVHRATLIRERIRLAGNTEK